MKLTAEKAALFVHLLVMDVIVCLLIGLVSGWGWK